MEYKVIAVLWEDHAFYDRVTLPKNPDKEITPTLTVGILVKETDKTYIIASTIERYKDYDECTFMIILKATVLSTKEYGTIEIKRLRR